MKIAPLTRRTGASISGLDLAAPSKPVITTLQETLAQYKVLFVTDQRLDPDALVAFSRQLGTLMRLPYIRPMETHPEIIAVLKEADEQNMGVFGGDWHSDFSFLPQPPSLSVLYAVENPPVGGDTLWCNMAAAYAALPPAQQETLRGQSVIHTGAPYGKANAPPPEEQFTGSIQMDRGNPEADRETVHPAVCRHPDTGEPALFLNPTYTTRFADRTAQDSAPRLAALYAHCLRPEFTVRHRWQPGTVALWDNRMTMHYAVNDYDGYRRLMYRTTVAGGAPLAA